ncbi:MAG: radical SAM protein [bacterium]|nr:radical SAM protein [bacterium]
MKIALVRPNYKTHLITPPLGLGYISSYLKSKGWRVTIIDGLNLNLSNDEIANLCQDCEVVGITCLSDFYLEAVDLSKKLKQAGKIVILGGVHPSVLPAESQKESGADYIVVGEGEVTFEELIRALSLGQNPYSIAGVFSLSRQTEFKPRELIVDLDSLPFPDWGQLDPRKYQKAPHGALVKNFPVAPIVSTRGCPYSCKFCASPRFWGKRLRFRSPENVIAEIELLVKNFGVKEIHFEDDNLTLRREHAMAICNLIIARGVKISWATPNGIRADKVDEELLRLMKTAGCYYVVFGIESGNQKILENINKKETLADIEKAVKIANKLGMMTQGFFILGLPGETEETIKNSIDFAKRIPLDRAQFLILDLLPGSALWEEQKNNFVVDYKKESYHEPTWVPDTISPETLKKWQPKAFRSFFFRPGPLFSLIKFFRLSQIKYIINRLKDFKIFNS